MLIATTLVAAGLVWSMVSTDPKNPQEITLAITGDEWSAAEFYVTGTEYDVAITATFFLPAGEGTDYQFWVNTHETGTAALALGDFTVTLSVDGTSPSFGENPAIPGEWRSEKIFVVAGKATSAIVVSITPNAGASDLRGVSFDIFVMQA